MNYKKNEALATMQALWPITPAGGTLRFVFERFELLPWEMRDGAFAAMVEEARSFMDLFAILLHKKAPSSRHIRHLAGRILTARAAPELRQAAIMTLRAIGYDYTPGAGELFSQTDFDNAIAA